MRLWWFPGAAVNCLCGEYLLNAENVGKEHEKLTS